MQPANAFFATKHVFVLNDTFLNEVQQKNALSFTIGYSLFTLILLKFLQFLKEPSPILSMRPLVSSDKSEFKPAN